MNDWNAEVRAALAASGRGDLAALTATMLREAGGDRAQGASSLEERVAVGCAIRNRVMRRHRGASTYLAVCLMPWQFSAWNAGDPNRGPACELARRIAVWVGSLTAVEAETIYLAEGIIGGQILDSVLGATHYFNPHAVAAPAWSFWDKDQQRPRTPVAIVGSHAYYAGIA